MFLEKYGKVMKFSLNFGLFFMQSWSLFMPTKHAQLIVQCEAPKIAKLVYNSNNYGNYGMYNYSYWAFC